MSLCYGTEVIFIHKQRQLFMNVYYFRLYSSDIDIEIIDITVFKQNFVRLMGFVARKPEVVAEIC